MVSGYAKVTTIDNVCIITSHFENHLNLNVPGGLESRHRFEVEVCVVHEQVA